VSARPPIIALLAIVLVAGAGCGGDKESGADEKGAVAVYATERAGFQVGEAMDAIDSEMPFLERGPAASAVRKEVEDAGESMDAAAEQINEALHAANGGDFEAAANALDEALKDADRAGAAGRRAVEEVLDALNAGANVPRTVHIAAVEVQDSTARAATEIVAAGAAVDDAVSAAGAQGD
jgi:hypothetical protein